LEFRETVIFELIFLGLGSHILTFFSTDMLDCSCEMVDMEYIVSHVNASVRS